MIERQVVALVNSERWKNLVQLQIHYLDHNPAVGRKYAPITAGTAVIDQKLILPRVTIADLTVVLEQAAMGLLSETKSAPTLI